MERIIQQTSDGSHTVSIPALQVTYHSLHGAIQESMHVFIDAGLNPLLKTRDEISILEMGFGTGLNALLTLQQALMHQQKIYYKAIELFPLEQDLYKQLNYTLQLNSAERETYFEKMHECKWEEDFLLHPIFTLHKANNSFDSISEIKKFNLAYFDAFDPSVQPEVWSTAIFEKLFLALEPGGILVTYSSKGSMRRAMQSAGFSVEKLKGAKGKREMVRAVKPSLW